MRVVEGGCVAVGVCECVKWAVSTTSSVRPTLATAYTNTFTQFSTQTHSSQRHTLTSHFLTLCQQHHHTFIPSPYLTLPDCVMWLTSSPLTTQ